MRELGEFVTLKVRRVDVGGKMTKGTLYVSGVILAMDDHSVTLEREVHDDWRCTSTTVTTRIDRRRITKVCDR